MPIKYFGCKWIIRYIVEFSIIDEFTDELDRLDSDIVAILQDSVDHNGFIHLTFGVKTPSEAVFNEIAIIAKKKFGLDDWHTIKKSTYQNGFSIDMRKMPAHIIIPFQQYLYNAALRNASHQEALENRDKKNDYYALQWIIDDVFPNTLLQTPEKSEALGCSLYYLKFGYHNKYNALIFGIRLPKEITIKTFLKYTDTTEIFIEIKPIPFEEFYRGWKLSIMRKQWNERIIMASLLEKWALENKQKK